MDDQNTTNPLARLDRREFLRHVGAGGGGTGPGVERRKQGRGSRGTAARGRAYHPLSWGAISYRVMVPANRSR
jgi:hypothetical protein